MILQCEVVACLNLVARVSLCPVLNDSPWIVLTAVGTARRIKQGCVMDIDYINGYVLLATWVEVALFRASSAFYAM